MGVAMRREAVSGSGYEEGGCEWEAVRKEAVRWEAMMREAVSGRL